MKTFKDLIFEQHYLDPNAEHAVLNFNNGFGVSVLFGERFYSNGIDTYELAALKGDSLFYSEITNYNVLGYLTEEEVTKVMRKIQELPSDYYEVEDYE